MITSHVNTDQLQGRVIMDLAPSTRASDDSGRSLRRQAPYRLTGGNIVRDVHPPRGIALYATKEIGLVITVHNPIQFTSKDATTTTASEVPYSSPLFPIDGR